ncbi:MAG: Ig-like domain-containing protein, partial [Nanoarchaeota archaeon]
GNIAQNSTTFRIDTGVPALAILFPTNNSNSSNINLDVNFTAGDVSSISSCWYSNDTYLANITLASCANITTVIWSEGNHNVTVYANDTAGNYNFSSVSFRIDSVNPLIPIINPTNNTNTSNTALDVNYTIVDAGVFESCWYNNDTYNVANKSLGSGGTCSNITNITWAEGLHNVTIWVNDTAGNVGQNTTTFRIDSVVPALAILFPTNYTNSSNINLDVNFTAGDVSSISSCWYSNDTYLANITLSNCANITTVTWSEGNHNVTVYANDTAGNYNFSTVSFRVDSVSPTIPIVNPTNNTNTSNTALDVNYTIVDAGVFESCWYNNDTYNVLNKS